MSDVSIEVEQREAQGKNVNRRLRAKGRIPAVVYGAGRDSVTIEVEQHKLEQLLREEGENAVFLLQLGGTGKSRHAMIKELQRNSVTGQLLHVDFLRVLMDQKIHISVAIEPKGVPVGVKTEGGILDFVTREIDVECLPGNIPGSIEIDVTKLQIGDHIEVKDLEMPEGVELFHDVDTDRVVLNIAAPQEELPAEEEGEGDELLEAETAEPEVLKQRGPEEDAKD